MKFEKNCSYIGGGDTRPLQIVAIFFNPTLHFQHSGRRHIDIGV